MDTYGFMIIHYKQTHTGACLNTYNFKREVETKKYYFPVECFKKFNPCKLTNYFYYDGCISESPYDCCLAIQKYEFVYLGKFNKINPNQINFDLLENFNIHESRDLKKFFAALILKNI